MKYTKEALEHLKRKQLQKLCMDNNIKANGKNVVLIEQLLELFECDENNGSTIVGEEIKLPTGSEGGQSDASTENVHSREIPEEDKDNHEDLNSTLQNEKETDEGLATDNSDAKNDEHDDEPIINQKDNIASPKVGKVRQTIDVVTAVDTQLDQTAGIEVTGEKSCTGKDNIAADGILQENKSLIENIITTNVESPLQRPSSTKGMEHQESRSTKKKASYKPYTGPLPTYQGDSTFTPKGKKPHLRESVKDMSIDRSGHKNRREKYLQDTKNRRTAARNQNRTPLKK